MSGRLASFQGPSTPNSSPAQASKKRKPSRKSQSSVLDSPSSTTSPKNAPVESPFHRKLRGSLLELRAICELWDDLVLLDGTKSVKKLVDTKTELQNRVSMCKDGKPASRIVCSQIVLMEQCLVDLQNVLMKLNRQFTKMVQAVDIIQQLVSDAHRSKGWEWTDRQPVWVTWSLTRFATRIPDILPVYAQSLHNQRQLVDKLRSYESLRFEDAREILSVWIHRPELDERGWHEHWEPLCAVEVDDWD